MKQATRAAQEIRRMCAAVERTKSERLKNDYTKGIKRKTAELKEYCRYRKLDFAEVMRCAE